MLGVGALQHLDEDAAIGLVLVALATLLLHHIALRVHPHLVHPGVQHALALQPQPQFQLVARQHLVVVGAVAVGVGVQHAAGLLHVLGELAAPDVLAALKEQVLEEVGEAAAVLRFVLAAHVVHHAHGNDGRAVVLVQDHVQAVGQVVFGKSDLAHLGAGGQGGRGGEHGEEQGSHRSVVATGALTGARK